MNFKKEIDKGIGKEAYEKLMEKLGNSGSSGGPNNNDPEDLFEKFKKYISNRNVLPHVFRKSGGHFEKPCETALKKIIETSEMKPRKVMNINGRTIGKHESNWGNIGRVWARTTDGKVTNGGINYYKDCKHMADSYNELPSLSVSDCFEKAFEFFKNIEMKPTKLGK